MFTFIFKTIILIIFIIVQFTINTVWSATDLNENLDLEDFCCQNWKNTFLFNTNSNLEFEALDEKSNAKIKAFDKKIRGNDFKTLRDKFQNTDLIKDLYFKKENIIEMEPNNKMSLKPNIEEMQYLLDLYKKSDNDIKSKKTLDNLRYFISSNIAEYAIAHNPSLNIEKLKKDEIEEYAKCMLWERIIDKESQTLFDEFPYVISLAILDINLEEAEHLFNLLNNEYLVQDCTMLRACNMSAHSDVEIQREMIQTLKSSIKSIHPSQEHKINARYPNIGNKVQETHDKFYEIFKNMRNKTAKIKRAAERTEAVKTAAERIEAVKTAEIKRAAERTETAKTAEIKRAAERTETAKTAEIKRAAERTETVKTAEILETERPKTVKTAGLAGVGILERERLERERLEKERLEKERLEKERLEKERLEKERLEKERLEKERLEKERLEKERLEKERLEKERLERERFKKNIYLNLKLTKAKLDLFTSLGQILPKIAFITNSRVEQLFNENFSHYSTDKENFSIWGNLSYLKQKNCFNSQDWIENFSAPIITLGVEFLPSFMKNLLIGGTISYFHTQYCNTHKTEQLIDPKNFHNNSISLSNYVNYKITDNLAISNHLSLTQNFVKTENYVIPKIPNLLIFQFDDKDFSKHTAISFFEQFTLNYNFNFNLLNNYTAWKNNILITAGAELLLIPYFTSDIICKKNEHCKEGLDMNRLSLLAKMNFKQDLDFLNHKAFYVSETFLLKKSIKSSKQKNDLCIKQMLQSLNDNENHEILKHLRMTEKRYLETENLQLGAKLEIGGYLLNNLKIKGSLEASDLFCKNNGTLLSVNCAINFDL